VVNQEGFFLKNLIKRLSVKLM